MILIVSYSFSLFAFAIFIYSFFFAKELALKEQAIYWFYTSLIASILPQIKQLRYGDFEVRFKEELEKVGRSIEKKTEKFKDAAFVHQRLTQMQQEFFTSLSNNDLRSALESVNEALKELDDIEPHFPDDLLIKSYRAYFLKNRAMVMQKLNNQEEFKRSLDESEKVFKVILDKNPRDASAFNGLGSIAVLRGDLESALYYIEKAIELNPDYEAAKHDRKVILRRLKMKGR